MGKKRIARGHKRWCNTPPAHIHLGRSAIDLFVLILKAPFGRPVSEAPFPWATRKGEHRRPYSQWDLGNAFTLPLGAWRRWRTSHPSQANPIWIGIGFWPVL